MVVVNQKVNPTGKTGETFIPRKPLTAPPPPPPPPIVTKTGQSSVNTQNAGGNEVITDPHDPRFQGSKPDPNNPFQPIIPMVDPYSYEQMEYDYKPTRVADPERQMAKSLGFQRYQAGDAANAASQSGLQTAMSGLASTSGLSMADKRALQQQSQRNRVMGQQSAQAPFNQMQAQNLYETDQFNVANRQNVAAQNQQIMNQYEQDKAEFERNKAEVIYKQKMEEAMLARALAAAKQVS